MLGRDRSRWGLDARAYREIVYHDLLPSTDLVLTVAEDGVSYRVLTRDGSQARIPRFAYEGAAPGTRRGLASHVLAPTGRILVEHTVAPGGSSGAFLWGVTSACATTSCPDQNDDPAHPELLEWSTLMGGNGVEEAYSVARDVDGNVFITGGNGGGLYPVTPGAYDTTYDDAAEAYVSKLSPSGAHLWSTYVGGSCSDEGYVIVIDSKGNPVVHGITRSASFPTTAGAYDTTRNGTCSSPYDSFVLKLSAAGDQLLWSTFLGPTDAGGNPRGLALDAHDRPYVTGQTYCCTAFPSTPGSFRPSQSGGEDGFVSVLSAHGDSLLYSTFLGGSSDDEVWGVHLDSQGFPSVVGSTHSPDFPTTRGPNGPLGGTRDAFVTKLDPTLSTLVFSSVLGGSGSEYAMGVWSEDNRILVSGWTTSTDFPVTPLAIDQTFGGSRDGFVASFIPSLDLLQWSTYLGGGGDDVATNVIRDENGAVIVKGQTASSDFPTTADSFDPTFNGVGQNPCGDSFIAALSLWGTDLYMGTFFGGSHVENRAGLELTGDGRAVITGTSGSCDFPFTPGAFDSVVTGTLGDAYVATLRYVVPSALGVGGGLSPAILEVTAYPNPGRGSTFRVQSSRPGRLTVSVRDIAGRRVWSHEANTTRAGWISVRWDGREDGGRPCRPGIYLVSAESVGATARGKVTLLK